MAEMLLINPRRRRRSAASPKRRRVVARRRRNPLPARAASPAVRRALKARAVAGARRQNPARRRRRNPLAAMRRRRRNPISMGGGLNTKSIVEMLKQAAIGGAGAVAIDALMAQVNDYLPDSLKPTATASTEVGVNDAVKLGVTLLAGQLLAKPTKGLSRKMAMGALTVQLAGIIRVLMPSSVPLGYYSPARLVQGTNRVGPIRKGVNAYLPAGNTPLLNGVGAYMTPGKTALLSGVGRTAQNREGVSRYR